MDAHPTFRFSFSPVPFHSFPSFTSRIILNCCFGTGRQLRVTGSASGILWALHASGSLYSLFVLLGSANIPAARLACAVNSIACAAGLASGLASLAAAMKAQQKASLAASTPAASAAQRQTSLRYR